MSSGINLFLTPLILKEGAFAFPRNRIFIKEGIMVFEKGNGADSELPSASTFFETPLQADSLILPWEMKAQISRHGEGPLEDHRIFPEAGSPLLSVRASSSGRQKGGTVSLHSSRREGLAAVHVM